MTVETLIAKLKKLPSKTIVIVQEYDSLDNIARPIKVVEKITKADLPEHLRDVTIKNKKNLIILSAWGNGEAPASQFIPIKTEQKLQSFILHAKKNGIPLSLIKEWIQKNELPPKNKKKATRKVQKTSGRTEILPKSAKELHSDNAKRLTPKPNSPTRRKKRSVDPNVGTGNNR